MQVKPGLPVEPTRVHSGSVAEVGDEQHACRLLYDVLPQPSVSPLYAQMSQYVLEYAATSRGLMRITENIRDYQAVLT